MKGHYFMKLQTNKQAISAHFPIPPKIHMTCKKTHAFSCNVLYKTVKWVNVTPVIEPPGNNQNADQLDPTQ